MPVASVHDLTRSCALSGVSAPKWIAMLQLRAERYSIENLDEAAEQICKALIPLMLSFTSSDIVPNYLSAAVGTPTLPLPIYINAFPAIVLSSPDFLSHPVLLSKLVELALRSRYSYSAKSHAAAEPPPAVLSSSNQVKNVQTIEGVANLLKISYSFAAAPGPQEPVDSSGSHPNQISESLTTLLIILLYAIPTAHMPPPRAANSLIHCITELTQQFPISPQSRQSFDSWLVTFSLSAGTAGLGDSFGNDFAGGIVFDRGYPLDQDLEAEPNKKTVVDEEDMVACVAVIRALLETRPRSAPSLSDAVSRLLATYRSTIIPPLKHPTTSAPTKAPHPSGTAAHTPYGGATPGGPHMVHTPAGVGRTPAAAAPGQTPSSVQIHSHSNFHGTGGPLGRTPSGIANATTPHVAFAHTPVHPSQQAVHTPSAVTGASARTPSANPRTPAPAGRSGQPSMSPTTSLKSPVKPGQIRAQIFLEKLVLAASSLVAETSARMGRKTNGKGESEAGNIRGGPAESLTLVRAFVFGKLPDLISSFIKAATVSSTSMPMHRPDFRVAFEHALSALFENHTVVLDSCDFPSGRKPRGPNITTAGQFNENEVLDSSMLDSLGDDLATEDKPQSRSYRMLLLAGFVGHDLVSLDFARSLCSEVDSMVEEASRDEGQKMETGYGGPADVEMSGTQAVGKVSSGEKYFRNGQVSLEAQDSSLDINAYIEFRLSQGRSSEEVSSFVEHCLNDYHCHAALSSTIVRRFSALLSAMDLEPLSILSKILYQHDILLPIIALHTPIAKFVAPSLEFLDDFDFDAFGDPQWALTHVGDIVLFLQFCLYRFDLRNVPFTSTTGGILSTDFLHMSSSVYCMAALPSEVQTTVQQWLQTVFDNNNEGIDDNLLRSTYPKTLSAISGTLFVEAIRRNQSIDTLRHGGASYFLGDLLSWTLAGVIQALVNQSYKEAYNAGPYLQALQMLVLDPGCPQVVLKMTARPLLRMLLNPHMGKVLQAASFDISVVKKAACDALGVGLDSLEPSAQANPQPDLLTFLQQFATTVYTTTPPPSLSPLLYRPPQQLLKVVHTALIQIGRHGDIQRPLRYIVTSLIMLSSPSAPSSSPPLVGLVVAWLVPSMIPQLDALPATEQALGVNVLASLASATLIQALRLERAILDVEKWEKNRTSEQLDLSADDDTDMDLGGSDDAAEEAEVKKSTPSRATKLALQLSRELRLTKSPTAASIRGRLVSSTSFVSNFPAFSKS